MTLSKPQLTIKLEKWLKNYIKSNLSSKYELYSLIWELGQAATTCLISPSIGETPFSETGSAITFNSSEITSFARSKGLINSDTLGKLKLAIVLHDG